MDEVVISIAGEPHWLWRAVDQNGIVLDVLVQRRRDGCGAKIGSKAYLTTQQLCDESGRHVKLG
jgi:transposase-like protein